MSYSRSYCRAEPFKESAAAPQPTPQSVQGYGCTQGSQLIDTEKNGNLYRQIRRLSLNSQIRMSWNEARQVPASVTTLAADHGEIQNNNLVLIKKLQMT